MAKSYDDMTPEERKALRDAEWQTRGKKTSRKDQTDKNERDQKKDKR